MPDTGTSSTQTLGTDTLSVQLYTVREALSEDVDGSLSRIAEFGYKQVEPFAFQNFYADLAAALPKYGLTAPTTHTSLIDADVEEILSAAKELGIKTVITPMSDPEQWKSAEGI